MTPETPMLETQSSIEATRMPLTLASDTSQKRYFGKAWHRRVAGLHVMKLAGSDYEMGLQHGTLLRDAIPRGPLAYYRDYLAKMLRQIGAGAAAPAIWFALKQTVGRSVAARLPDFAQEAVRGLADGAGLSRSEVLEGCVMSDSLMWMASRFMELSRSQNTVRHRVALELGCSSALAFGDATTDGRLLHARNFDYHGVAPWPREAAVVFHEPDLGQRYVSVTSAGILLGGVTAMNEAGLTLTVHQHMFSDGARLGGVPIGIVGDIVMRRAKTLEDAARILDDHRHIGCWTYIVSDGKRREVLCHEQNPARRTVVRTSGDTFAYANIYLDPELAKSERDLYGSYWRANIGRQQRLRALLRDGHGRHDPDSMSSILGDTGGDGCRVHRAIGMMLTVGSVVFRPEDGVVWVATGKAPVCHNPFEAFSLESEDHAPQHGRLTSGVPGDRDAVEAFVAYREAYLAYFDRNDPDDSRRLLGRALRLRPTEPLYHALDGLLALNVGQGGEAEASFDAALRLGHPDAERLATFRLWRGRARDLKGDRMAALADYREAAAAHKVDPPVQRAAEKGLKKPFGAKEARRTRIDFAYADVVSP